MSSFAKSVSRDSPVERRSHRRRRIDVVTYVDLGVENGGILVNLGEGGVGFQSVARLELGQAVILKFKLPGEKKRLESRAEVAWSSESGKRGGLRFVELSAAARALIRAFTGVESPVEDAPKIPVRSETHETVHWVWREPYLAALREQNPHNLRERLLTAEKAILFRMEALHGAPDGLPELQALREALNSLYAREPKKRSGPSGIVEDKEEYEWERRNWTTLGAAVAVAVIASLATGWTLGSKNSGNEIQTIGTNTEPKESITNSDNEFASVRDVHILDTPPQGLRTPPKDNGASTPLKNTPSHIRDAHPLNDAKDLHAQPEDREGSMPAEPNPGGTTSEQSLDRLKEALEVRAEPQANPLPSIANQAKTTEVQAITPAAQEPISQVSVTVSFSTYPSLRIPPELKSQAVGAKLQIGQVVSRIDPIYPEEAERQRVEGTVNLHAIVGTNGSIKELEGIRGPSLLVPAAATAVRQWRYRPTMLGDQPIETSQDVTIVFRLSRNAASSN